MQILNELLFKKTDPYTNLKSYEKNLFHLIIKKDFDLFRSIIDSQHVDPNIRDQSGNTLLIHSVVDDDNILFTQHLLIKGADINAADKHGMTAVFRAAYWGEEKSLLLLLSKKKVDLEATNNAFKFDLNPLVASIFKNHHNIAKILLHKGADPFHAEKLIAKNYNIFKDFYAETYQELLDFYKRWHKGKKQFIFAKYLAEKSRALPYFNGRKHQDLGFHVELLNSNCFKIILTEYL